MSDKKTKDVIDLGKIIKVLWAKKKVFFILWPIVFVLSCIWILPEPRYYTSSVSMAPETTSEDIAGGLSSIASSFGVNLGGASNDAIYPMLYPDLLTSNEFIVSLMNIQVVTEDSTVATDYYTYLTKHQKKNWLTYPFVKTMNSIKKFFSDKKSGPSSDEGLNPFMLSEYDFGIVEKVKKNITCSVDKQTDVISLSVKDQDRVICAVLADSIRVRLQYFITNYRTSKARLDVEHYTHLADSAKKEYEKVLELYSSFCDRNQDIVLQKTISKRERLENDVQLKQNTYTAMCTQLEAMKAKLQEKTPAFTTLVSATVPIKPAGPKRMIFVAGMLILSTFITSFWLVKDILIVRRKE